MSGTRRIIGTRMSGAWTTTCSGCIPQRYDSPVALSIVKIQAEVPGLVTIIPWHAHPGTLQVLGF